MIILVAGPGQFPPVFCKRCVFFFFFFKSLIDGSHDICHFFWVVALDKRCPRLADVNTLKPNNH